MLAHRFRNVHRWLREALYSLVERGRQAGEEVAAITALTAARLLRLETLMDRFEAGTLRARAASTRRVMPRERVPVAAAPARPWPEHLAGWLHLVGFNHPVQEIRLRWTEGTFTVPSTGRYLVEFARQFGAMLADDGEMRGFLAVSREARRLGRWLHRMSSKAALPEILKEPPRPKPARTEPRPRRRRDRWAPPKPRREPGPFETHPPGLLRHERERRGLWVKPPIICTDPSPPSLRANHRQHTILG